MFTINGLAPTRHPHYRGSDIYDYDDFDPLFEARDEARRIGRYPKFSDAVSIMEAYIHDESPYCVAHYLDGDDDYPYQEAYVKAFENLVLDNHYERLQPDPHGVPGFLQAMERYYGGKIEWDEDYLDYLANDPRLKETREQLAAYKKARRPC